MAEVNYEELTQEEKDKTFKKVVISSFLGNFIEWFDYGSYSYFAAIIGAVFFPSDDPLVATMNSFAVFALSFLVRPLGALFWGNMGDKKGRQWTLMTTILIVSCATFLIGCLPGYNTIGIASVVLLLLLRMTQSFSVSGEYAGASTFIAEYAPAGRRGFFVSMVPASTSVGLLVATIFATVLFSVFGADSEFVHNIGWRIPFILALPLGLVTNYIRRSADESPVFKAMQDALENKEDVTKKAPVRDLFSKHLKITIISFGTCVLNAVGFYAVLTFMPTYLTSILGYDAASSNMITNITLVAYIVMIFISGQISDKIGRKKMMIIAASGFIICTVPMFMLMHTLNFAAILVAELVMNALLTVNDGTLASYLSETFPTEVRFTGFAFCFNCANAFFGGSCSFICLKLTDATGSSLAPAWYMVGIACIALVCMLLSTENHNKSLSEV